MSERLAVVLYGSVVGHLERADRHAEMTFAYDPGYAASDSAVALSVRMPPSERTYSGRDVSTFVNGLLPESRATLRRWADRLETDSGDTFAILSRMGWDCPGAVQFCPPDQLDEMMSRAGEYEPIDEAEIAARLRALRDDSASWSLPDEHWSLPGQQEKFTLAALDGTWNLAKGSAATTHIVKPGIKRMMNQALVEHVTMCAAAGLEVDVAESTYVHFEDEAAIVVERFDRFQTDSGVGRIHQEDFCQATGFDPERKYEANRGPGLKAYAKVIESQSTDLRHDRRALADYLAINYVSGSPDGHAKNLSLTLRPDGTFIAPLYDLATGLTYEPGPEAPERSVALSVGGRRIFGQVLPKHWDRAADDIGIDSDEMRSRVRKLAEDYPDAFATACAAIDDPDAKEVMARTKDRLGTHCRD